MKVNELLEVIICREWIGNINTELTGAGVHRFQPVKLEPFCPTSQLVQAARNCTVVWSSNAVVLFIYLLIHYLPNDAVSISDYTDYLKEGCKLYWGHSTHLNEQKCPSQRMSRNQ
jgi:hypothetical protein